VKEPLRTRTALVAAATVVGAVVLAAAPAASAHHATGPCGFHREEGRSVRAHARDQIRCAVDRWMVPGGKKTALCIAHRESDLLPWAESRDGLNKGLFQQHVRYWGANYDAYTWHGWELPRRILSGRTNAVVSIRMAHEIGWGPWGGRDCG
jgi:hypothetical protein